MAAIFAYPVASLGLSMLGTWDFLDATVHLLHGRVKKMVASTFMGGVKLSFTVLSVSMVTDPFFQPTSSEKKSSSGVDPFNPDSFDLMGVASALKTSSYKVEDEAGLISSFCKSYFMNSNISNYDIAQSCISPLINSSPLGLKEWVMQNPVHRASLFSSAVENRGLSYKLEFSNEPIVVAEPLRNCTEGQIKLKQIYNSSSSIIVPEANKSSCDQQRIKFLDFVFSQPSLEAAKRLAFLSAEKNLSEDGFET